MIGILMIVIVIVALFCLFGAIRCLLEASRESQLPDIEDIEIEEDMA
jgi:hypothetical protein